MPRPRNQDLILPWKITMPATLAGRIEFVLLDQITGKPKYGARNHLVAALLENWLAREAGMQPDELPPVPSIEELKAM